MLSLLLSLAAAVARAEGPPAAISQPEAARAEPSRTDEPAPRVGEPPVQGASAATVAPVCQCDGVQAQPKFAIEKIVVEGARPGAARIVVSETLLSAGKEYEEAELQQALHRVERLPFVVEADFSLRRGSERGRYELVIRVVETLPLFVGAALGGYAPATDAGSWRGSAALEAGARLFFGGQQEINVRARGYGAFVSDERSVYFPELDLGYTHHDLLDRRLVGTLTLGGRRSSPIRNLVHSEWHLSGQLAFPLGRTDVVRTGISYTRRGIDAKPAGGVDATADRLWTTALSAAWESNTTDDPFTPHRGRRITAGGEAAWNHVDVVRNESTERFDTQRWTATVDGDSYLPLGNLLSLGLGGALDASSSRDSSQPELASQLRGELRAALQGSLWSRSGGSTRFWWQLSGSLEFGIVEANTIERPTTATVSLVLAARGRWGTARVALEYRRTSYSDQYRWIR